MTLRQTLLASAILVGGLPTVVAGQVTRPGSLQGGKYALLVGVREYDPNELRELPYAEPDVEELAQVFRDDGYRRVVLMTQTAGAKTARFLPDSTRIPKELDGIIADRQPEDTVVVVFAG